MWTLLMEDAINGYEEEHLHIFKDKAQGELKEEEEEKEGV